MREKVFKTIVDHIYPIRDNFKINQFDYPNYGGLPKRVSYTLSPEAVDALQDILKKDFSLKKEFSKAYKNRLAELGESVIVVRGRRFVFSAKEFENLFDYATSIRESTLEFCNKEITAKQWTDLAYEKETKNTIKGMLRKFGVKGTRSKMRRYCNKFSWMGSWKD